MRNVARDAIRIAAAPDCENDADLSASSAYSPPAPSELFARLGVMLAVALAFGLLAQLVMGNLPH